MSRPRPHVRYALPVLLGHLLTAPAQVVSLHSFVGGANDGALPQGSLLQSGSTFYGMTSRGGSADNGTVFRINTDGTGFGLVHSFTGSDGAGTTVGSLIQSGSALYGMTNRIVFRVGADGTGFGPLHTFNGGPNDGAAPCGTLLQSGNTFYGMTIRGGSSDRGTVFRVNTDGTGFSLLRSLTDPVGSAYGSLTQSGQTLYGMTYGSIFRVGTDGTGYGLLHTFGGGPNDGDGGVGTLLLSGETLYGMTHNGGNSGPGYGTIFRIDTDGTGFRLLHSFNASDGAYPFPSDSLVLIGSTLYGMTPQGGNGDGGTVFRIETDGTGFAMVHQFGDDPTSGGRPFGNSLTQVGSTLYGLSYAGGNANVGTIFSLPVPEPSSLGLAGLAAACVGSAYRRRRSESARGSQSGVRRLLLALALAPLAASPAAAQVVYTATDLGTFGGVSSNGTAVNNLGVVVGQYTTAGGDVRAFRWTAAGGMTDLGTLGGPITQPASVNDAGEIAGVAVTATFDIHAFRTPAGGRVDSPGADLDVPGGVSLASGVNAGGQVTGQAFVGGGLVAFRTTPGGNMSTATFLGTLGGAGSQGVAINASGQVAGVSDTSAGFSHAFRTGPAGDLSEPGADLGTLGGPNSTGTGIDPTGRVVGYSDTADGHTRAFRTTATGLVSDPGADLGTLPGFDDSAATGINAAGFVVGNLSSSAPSSERAFLFDGMTMRDLNALISPTGGLVLVTALGISDTGYITGTALVNGEEHAFLLTPIPEPGSAALVPLAVAGWLVRRRRPRAS